MLLLQRPKFSFSHSSFFQSKIPAPKDILAHQVPNAKELRQKKLAKQGELPREVRKAQARLLSPPAPKAKLGLQDIV